MRVVPHGRTRGAMAPRPPARPGLEPRPVGTSGPRPSPWEPRTRNAAAIRPWHAERTAHCRRDRRRGNFVESREFVPTRSNCKEIGQSDKFAVRHSVNFCKTSTVTFSRMIDRVAPASHCRLQPRNHGLKRPHRRHWRDVAGAPTESSKYNSNMSTHRVFHQDSCAPLLSGNSIRKGPLQIERKLNKKHRCPLEPRPRTEKQP